MSGLKFYLLSQKFYLVFFFSETQKNKVKNVKALRHYVFYLALNNSDYLKLILNCI